MKCNYVISYYNMLHANENYMQHYQHMDNYIFFSYIIQIDHMSIYQHDFFFFFLKHSMIFKSSNNHTKWSTLRPIKTRYLSVPSLPQTSFGFIHHRITVIPKHSTKPEDISPGIKTKSQHSPGLPRTNIKISNIQSQKSWN